MIAFRTLPRPALLACATASILITGCGEAPQEVQEEPGEEPRAEQFVANLALANPSEFLRVDEPVLLTLNELGITIPTDVSLSVTEGDSVHPSHLIDSDGDGTQDALIFVADFDAAQKRTFDIRTVPDQGALPPKRTHAEVSIRQGGAWDGKTYKGGEFVSARLPRLTRRHSTRTTPSTFVTRGRESSRIRSGTVYTSIGATASISSAS